MKYLRFTKHGRYGAFSNFYECAVVYDDIAYKNSEAAWQSLKTMDIEERKQFSDLNAHDAKRRGRYVKLREDWEYVKVPLMIDVLHAKFSQHEDLKELLLSTGDKHIIEDTTPWHDNVWGDCYCDKCINTFGQNLLGFCLMRVRKELEMENAKKISDNR